MTKYQILPKKPLIIWHDTIADIIEHDISDILYERSLDAIKSLVNADSVEFMTCYKTSAYYQHSLKHEEIKFTQLVDLSESNNELTNTYAIYTHNRTQKRYNEHCNLVTSNREIRIGLSLDNNLHAYILLTRKDKRKKFSDSNIDFIKRALPTIKAITCKWAAKHKNKSKH